MLGAGGMGEVYLAQDTRLDRKVAIKLLPSEVTNNEDRLRRFVQEAKAAAALSHPNVAHIYEVGEADGTHFIAMEFVDGDTLRTKVRSGGLTNSEALDIAIQAASALASAHEAGIVHRDIKPENIMVRTDGIVKIVDFGLAKTAEQSTSTTNPEAPTAILVKSTPGMIMGTITYMSPEQARGHELDARTDIWSLGVVLYEMLTGQPPFKGETYSDLIVSLLDRDPPPLAACVPDLPPDLPHIVRKALRKDREERYQTIKSMLVDLRELKHELEFKAKLDLSGEPHITAGPMRNTIEHPALHAADGDEAVTRAIPATHSISGAGTDTAPIKRQRSRAFVAMSGLAALLIGLGAYGLIKYFGIGGGPGRLRAAAEPMKQTRLTTLGSVLEAFVSPDGHFVAYIAKEGTQHSLYVRQVSTNSTVAVLPPSEALIWGVSFAPDGSHIYYLRADTKSAISELYEVATLGGSTRKLITDVDSMISFGPGGREFAFRREYPDKQESMILIAKVDGTDEHAVARRKRTLGFVCNPAWSPDGKTIASLVNGSEDVQAYSLLAINVANGDQTPVGSKRWRIPRKVEWLPDGSELLLNVKDQPGDQEQIWRAAYPDGDVFNVTNDFNRYEGVSVTADGVSLVTVQSRRNVNIFVAPVTHLMNASQVTSVAGVSFYGLGWTPEGRIVYGSNAGGHRDIWIMGSDGSRPQQLTNDTFVNHDPVPTPDGRFIVYASERTRRPNIWRMNIDGGNPVQITNGKGEFNPSVTQDSRWVVYASTKNDSSHLWKVSIDGGEPQELTQKSSHFPAVSPDGKYIAFQYWPDQIDSPSTLSVVPISGGTPIRSFGPKREFWRWSVDSRSLVYVDSTPGFSNLMSVSLENDSPKPLTNFKTDRIFAFAFSHDGRQIAFLRGSINSDVVMISRFR